MYMFLTGLEWVELAGLLGDLVLGGHHLIMALLLTGLKPEKKSG